VAKGKDFIDFSVSTKALFCCSFPLACSHLDAALGKIHKQQKPDGM
jgi:hypothetical protein